ncbi:hypothetical protein F2P81_008357 [Scophthalmus maximus]|uniref:Uncharacterized protein n=1 Tax=Scophthalmus maximus TaxID=52904 RepID=A0A6A4TD33_SCOMX|nr:hypothetical protein F2P81_008357 [Scophthalmus maximus]
MGHVRGSQKSVARLNRVGSQWRVRGRESMKRRLSSPPSQGAVFERLYKRHLITLWRETRRELQLKTGGVKVQRRDNLQLKEEDEGENIFFFFFFFFFFFSTNRNIFHQTFCIHPQNKLVLFFRLATDQTLNHTRCERALETNQKLGFFQRFKRRSTLVFSANEVNRTFGADEKQSSVRCEGLTAAADGVSLTPAGSPTELHLSRGHLRLGDDDFSLCCLMTSSFTQSESSPEFLAPPPLQLRGRHCLTCGGEKSCRRDDHYPVKTPDSLEPRDF